MEGYPIIIHLDEKKKKIRLSKMKVRGSGYYAKGRPKKLKNEEDFEDIDENADERNSF